MTGLKLKDMNVSVGDLIKWGLSSLPIAIPLLVAIVQLAEWREKVDLRLDDMDKDLRAIHLILDRRSGFAPAPASIDEDLARH